MLLRNFCWKCYFGRKKGKMHFTLTTDSVVSVSREKHIYIAPTGKIPAKRKEMEMFFA